MALLEINNLKKTFDDNEVLKDISLHVDQGQVVAIIGPSGSGKSTLLRCATTLETATSGEIKYGEDYLVRMDGDTPVFAEKEELKRIRQHFGLVFQNYNLFPHFSVLKNVMEAPVVVDGRNKAEVEAEARQLLKQMGLEGTEEMYPCQLSGGMQQRVSIARALAKNPEILFFDEPTSALDPELTGEILKVIRQLAEQHMTMVIVTHEMNFARDVADYIIFMDGGYIVEQGPAEEVIDHPQTERLQSFLSRINNG
jgi:polar amino acid transport system ATP-binding protein